MHGGAGLGEETLGVDALHQGAEDTAMGCAIAERAVIEEVGSLK